MKVLSLLAVAVVIVFIFYFFYFFPRDSFVEISDEKYEKVAMIAKDAHAKNMVGVEKLIRDSMADDVIYLNEYKEIKNMYVKANVNYQLK